MGNSLFIDDSFEPYPDQWSFLGSLKRISAEALSNILSKAETTNRILPVRIAPPDEFALTPWEAPPSRRIKESLITEALPKSVSVVLSDQIYIPKEGFGIRLEDDVVIQKKGELFNLMKNIPIEIDEIEELMKNKK